jgi:hypothetical protein
LRRRSVGINKIHGLSSVKLPFETLRQLSQALRSVLRTSNVPAEPSMATRTFLPTTQYHTARCPENTIVSWAFSHDISNLHMILLFLAPPASAARPAPLCRVASEVS